MSAILICDDGDVDEVAPYCESHGFGIEVQAFYIPVALEDDTKVEQHRSRITKIPVRALHAPFGDLCPGSFDSAVRALARTRFEQGYKVARALDAGHIVFHHGYVPGTSGRDGWIKRSTEFWRDFVDGKSETVRYHLENMLEREPGLLSDVVDEIDRPNVDVVFDVGHAHCYSRVSPLKWVETLGSRIGYVHLHDNHGEADEHLGLGQGTIPMTEICQSLREYAPNALWAIEAEGVGVSESVNWLTDNGFMN